MSDHPGAIRRRGSKAAARGALWCCVIAVVGACATKPRAPERPPDEGWVTASPGGQVSVQVRVFDLGGTAGYPAGPRPYYRAFQGAGDKRLEVLAWSPLGLSRADQDFTEGLAFVDETSRPVSEEYTLPRGKRHQYTNHGVERRLGFRNAAGARVEIELRVFDDGFGFRYRFPETAAGPFTVTGETTGFRLPEEARAYLAPYDGRAPNYQNPWLQDLPAGTPSPSPAGWAFPALFRTKEGRYLLVTESNLDGGYCATHLGVTAEDGAERLYRIAFPEAAEARGVGSVNPSSALPWVTPWRVVITGERLGTIVESSLVTDLAAPTALADTSWIKPGRASWSWWSDEQSPKSYGQVAAFVDLAAGWGWEYSTVDAGWPALSDGVWRGLVRYANARKVGLLFWYDSGVRHAEAIAGPQYPMYRTQSRQAELDRLSAAGARGVKVDFFESDKQDVIRLYLDILKDAAARHLVVDFHGSTLPRGWERTYPNLLTMESVRGAEMYKLDAAFAQYAPTHNTMQVFTRNVVGPMDYTPVTFTDTKFHHRTTFAHELALSVVFESGLQHFADSAETYLGMPEEVRGFLAGVPAAWDETRFFEGEPGKLAVLGRRIGRTWYVAGINGEGSPKKVTIAMDFLGNGTYDMLIAADGKSDASFVFTKRQRNGLDAQAIELRPYGGFAMRLVPLQ